MNFILKVLINFSPTTDFPSLRVEYISMSFLSMSFYLISMSFFSFIHDFIDLL